MASALREILAKFVVNFDDSQLERGKKAIDSTVGALKGFAGALGIGLSLGAVKSFIGGINDQVIALDKQSRYLRVGIEDLQRWQGAAQIAGASTDALNSALEQMRFRAKKPTDALLKVADRIAAIKDPTRRAMIGTAMLGNSYRELEPLLEKGSSGIKKLLNETKDLAVVFGKDSVAAAKSNRESWGRLKLIWSGLANQLGALLLPLVADLSKALVPVAVWLKNLTHHTHLFRAAAVVLGGGGLFTLVRRFGGLSGALKAAMPYLRLFAAQLWKVSLAAFKVVAPILILEDFLVFLAGGKSAFGEILDKVFGKGTQERVRRWIQELIDSASKFFDHIRNSPKQAVKEMTEWLSSIVPEGREIFQGLSEAFVALMTTLMGVWDGGWTAVKEFFGAIWDSIVLVARIAFTELGFASQLLTAQIADSFIKMWNSILEGGKQVLKFAGKVASAVGATSIGETLSDASKALGMGQGRTSSEIITQARDQERLRIARQADDVSARFNRVAEMRSTNNVTVNVPPGTPQTLANRVAKETTKAVQKNNQATRSALVPGQG